MSTTTPLNEALVASMAAGLLDDYQVNSLTDNSPLGRFMNREFGTVRREMQELYPWYWGGARAVLPETDAPAFGWLAAYIIPDDFLGMRRLYDPNNTSSDKPVNFEIEGDKILCNVRSGIWIKYSADVTNLAKWRALPARAFAARLAMYASQRVTGKAGYFDKCAEAFRNAMSEATRADALHRGMVEDVYVSGSDGLDSVTARGSYIS